MSDPSTPQSSKSRRSRGMQPPDIEGDATRVEDEAAVAADQSAETAAMEPGEPGPAEEARPESEAPAEPQMPPETASSATEQPPRKSRASSGRGAVIGLVCGLIGGVAGAGVMHYAVLSASPGAMQADGQIKALETRLASAEAALRDNAQKIAAADKAQQALSEKIKAVSGSLDAQAQQAGSATGGNAEAATAELDRRMAALDGATQAAAASAKNQIDGLQRMVAGVNGRLDMVEKQVTAATKPAADPMPAIRYVLLMRLDQAVASGQPFGDALKAMGKAGIGGAALADLEPFAATGAPTAAQLKTAFRDPSQAMIARERGQSGESFTDKLARMGKSVLRIRPQGTPDGTDIASMVVRIEAALDRSAFGEAAGLWNSLPDPMKQLSAAWGKRLNDRAGAAAALAKLSTSAVTGLDGAAR